MRRVVQTHGIGDENMKIRTDFVTNSSSSCYFFKECDLEEAKAKLERIINDVSRNDPKQFEFYLRCFTHDFSFWGNNAEKYEAVIPSFRGDPTDFGEWIAEDFFSRVRPVSQLGFWDIDDIDGVFSHGMMEMIFYGTEQYLSSGRRTHPFEHYIGRIENRDISEEIADKIAGSMIPELFLYLRDRINLEENNDSPFSSDNEIPEVFTREVLDGAYAYFVYEVLSEQEQCLYRAFVETYRDSLYSRFEKYLGLTPGEIYEKLIGKVWVFYCDCGENYGHYVMSKEFEKLPEYLFGGDYF